MRPISTAQARNEPRIKPTTTARPRVKRGGSSTFGRRGCRGHTGSGREGAKRGLCQKMRRTARPISHTPEWCLSPAREVRRKPNASANHVSWSSLMPICRGVYRCRDSRNRDWRDRDPGRSLFAVLRHRQWLRSPIGKGLLAALVLIGRKLGSRFFKVPFGELPIIAFLEAETQIKRGFPKEARILAGLLKLDNRFVNVVRLWSRRMPSSSRWFGSFGKRSARVRKSSISRDAISLTSLPRMRRRSSGVCRASSSPASDAAIFLLTIAKLWR